MATLSLLAGFWGPVNTYLLKYIVDTASLAQPGDISFLVWPAALIAINFIVLDNFTWRGIALINRYYQPLITNAILSQVFEYLAHAPFSFFQEKMSGRLATQLNILATSIEHILEDNAADLFRGTSLIVVALFAMWTVDARFFCVLLGWFLIFLVVSLYMSRKVVTLSDSYAGCESKNAGQYVDSLANINTVRMFAGSKYEMTRLWSYLGDTKHSYRAMKGHLILLHAIQGGLIALMLSGMLYYLVKLYGKGQITIGDFVLIIGLSVEVGHISWFTMRVVDEFNLGIGKCKQSLQALLTPYDMVDIPGARPIDISQGAIDFQAVSFAYKGGGLVFQDLDQKIYPQEKVGLVGFSGAGKSTFVNLLLRFYNLDTGKILIDDQDISQITRDSLRDQITMIPQDTSLFHRSIMENIRYGRMGSSDAEVIDAAKQANAHEFIEKLPQGYDSFVGERGVKLSGGQRQRIAIARAMLKKAPIVILDEATSALDSVTEREIQESFKELMNGRTTIVIAHRLSTLQEMDRVLVFDDGKIIEDGTHAQLLKMNGHYAKMWHMQAGGFLPDEKN